MKKALLLLSFIFIALSCSKSDDEDTNDLQNELNDDITNTTIATLNTDEGNHTFDRFVHQQVNSADLKTINFLTDDFSKTLNISVWYSSIEGNENRIVIHFNEGTFDANNYPNLYSYDS